ncbi:hypothetical protein CapIbe_014823 [Capra ibex]
MQVLQGVGVGGIWPEAQSLHGRSRSQGCGSQDAPRQLSGKPPAAAWNTGVLEAEPTLSRSSYPRPGLSLPPSASGPSSIPRSHLPPGLSPVLGSCVQRSL